VTHKPDFSVALSGDIIASGEAYLEATPVLRVHAGTQPDLFLRWNAIPPELSAIDVVVHLHGFSRNGSAMPISEKVPRSGLDLRRRTRPTLALLPRGNWLRHSWYDFPALLAGGIDRLVDYGLERFSASLPSAVARKLDLERLVLTAHSGGGMPAVDAIAGSQRPPDELHVFDGLYGRDPATGDPMRGLEALEAWLAARLGAEPARPGALRVVYIEQQTGPFSRQLGAALNRQLAQVDPMPGLRRRYRVERSGVPHARIAERCGPDLLAASDAEFDWQR
jgi:hypothetical protein